MNLDIPFGEWLPDLPDFNNPGSTVAKNVIPHEGSYLPFLDLATTSDALTAYCRGAVAFADDDGNSEIFAGDQTKLYRLASEVWADKSGTAYTTATGYYWKFIKWGEKVIATNGSDPIQIKDFGAAGNFAALGGSPPKARHITTVRSFIVLGDVNDGTRYPNKIQWSGQNLETSWGSNPATQADSQSLVGDGGAVMALTGGSVGLILQERSLWEMSYVGPPVIFRLDETAPGIGTPAANSAVRVGATTFFLGQDGFYQYTIGQGATRIGDNKVDLWFFERINRALIYRMIGAIDYRQAKVCWAYPTAGNTDCNEILIYDWTNGKWSYAEVSTETIFAGLSPGTTLEGLDAISADLDALELSLDADQWKGGALSLWGFDTAHKSGSFGGLALTATVETAEVGSPDGSMLFVNGIRPMVDGASINTLYCGTRNVQNTNFSYGSPLPANSIGEHNTRASGRYFRIKAEIAGGFDRAMGVKLRAKPNGIR